MEREPFEILEALTSPDLVHELRTFLRLLAAQRDGFAARATATAELFRSPGTAFCLVASPAPTTLEDAQFLGRELAHRNVPVRTVLLNRAFANVEPQTPTAEISTEMPRELRELAIKLKQLMQIARTREASFAARAQRLCVEVAPDATLIAIEDCDAGIHRISELATVFDNAKRL